MEERLEFASFNQFLEQSERVKVMFSKDGYHFYDSYDDLELCNLPIKGDLMLPQSVLKANRKYYVIKANS